MRFWTFIVPDASHCQSPTLVLDLGLQWPLHSTQSHDIPWGTARNSPSPDLELLQKFGHCPSVLAFFVQAPLAHGTDMSRGFHREWCGKERTHSKITPIAGVINSIHCLVAEGPWNPDIVCNTLCMSIKVLFVLFCWEESRCLIFFSKIYNATYLEIVLQTDAIFLKSNMFLESRCYIFPRHTWLVAAIMDSIHL